MNAADPIATLLADLDRPAAPRVEFADELRGRLLRELEASRSHGFVTTRLLARRSRLRFVLVAVVLFIVLAGIAAATYVLVETTFGGGPREDALTFFEMPARGMGPDPAAAIVAVGADGSRRTVWRCPHDRFCGEPTSVAWSPDGRRVAITLTEVGANSTYPTALHIVDLATRTDRTILAPVYAPYTLSKIPQPRFEAAARRFGCLNPESVAWSPDGKRLAYACGESRFTAPDGPSIWLVNADGSSPRRLRTGTFAAAWPSWSPDGHQIAFSTDDYALTGSNIYVVNLDGTRLRHIAHGVGPVWSPRGDTIAYRSSCGGVRLVTPAGRDVTPGSARVSCPGIGPPGWPVWSPDGRTIAIATRGGVGLYEVHADGTHLRRITSTTGLFSPPGTPVVRPAWRPGLASARRSRTTNEPKL